MKARGNIIGQTFTRLAPLNRQVINEDQRTVEVAFSSETEEVKRFYGREILDHSPNAIRIQRLQAGAPLLFGHDQRELLGVVERVRIGKDRVGRATVRFGQSQRAREAFQDVHDGILRNVSVGYLVHNVRQEESADEIPVFRVIDWEPLEISMVSVPADISTGVGRSHMKTKDRIHMEKFSFTEEEEDILSPKQPEQWSETEKERHRSKEILALAKMAKKPEAMAVAERAIQDGTSLNQFRKMFIERFYSSPKPLPTPMDMDLGFGRELESYSLVKVIKGLVTRDFSDCGQELEISRHLQKVMGRQTDGLMVPREVLATRVVEKFGSGSGAGIIPVIHRPDLFVDELRSRSLLMRLGATPLTGLSGDISIPKKGSITTATWVGEGVDVGESTPDLSGTITLTPKTIGGFVKVTRKMILQSSPDIESLIRADLAQTLATGLDVAVINGSGTGAEPEGLLNKTGLSIVALGTDGAAPTWDDIVELESQVAVANADVGSLGYLTNAAVRGKLKRTERFSGTNGQPIWADVSIVEGLGTLNGYRAGVSNNVPSNLTKGSGTNLSAMLFGNWADVLVGTWGPGIDLLIDPYTHGKAGDLQIIAHMDSDVAVRRIESFAAIVDAVTA